ncbi:MAG: hypothetical protein OEZ58_01640 [Gammaproteobacteria bacterium]|nr:hypothetical protein [Gammaproteobacteria bacterium]MDH5727663.1 hypothetical protein [Gammaproteobacteria bacterium]
MLQRLILLTLLVSSAISAAPNKQNYDENPTATEFDSRIAILPSMLKDRDTVNGKAFISYCTQCHDLPNPEGHTARSWPAVVSRMRQHSLNIGGAIPSDNTLKGIVLFLQDHAKQR